MSSKFGFRNNQPTTLVFALMEQVERITCATGDSKYLFI